MPKRIIATALWFVAAWELGSAVQWVSGMNGDVLPAALALVTASAVAFDPLRFFWTRTAKTRARNEVSPASDGAIRPGEPPQDATGLVLEPSRSVRY